MRQFHLFIIIIGFFGGTFVNPTLAQAKVWEVSHHWSDVVSTNPVTGQPVTYDDLYADFVNEEVNENFFANPNGYYYGALDCAEALYATRAIFASIHNLPFSVAGGTVTNNSTKFDEKHAPGKDRLRAFIQDMITHVNTTTLSQDTYTVKIDRKYVRPGDVVLEIAPPRSGNENHSLLLSNVNLDGSLKLLQGTDVDRKNPARTQNGIDTFKLTTVTDFSTPQGNAAKVSIRAWRHTDGSPDLGKDNDAPPFSMEAIRNTLAILADAKDDQIQQKAQGVCEYVQYRPKRVLAATLYKEDHNILTINPKTNKDAYDDLSTPNRDSFLRGRMVALEDSLCLSKSNDESAKFYKVGVDCEGTPVVMCKIPGATPKDDIIFPNSADSVDDSCRHKPPQAETDYDKLLDVKTTAFATCPITYGPNEDQTLSLSEFEISLLSDGDPLIDSTPYPYRHVSNNPNDDLDARWGRGNYQGSTSQMIAH